MTKATVPIIGEAPIYLTGKDKIIIDSLIAGKAYKEIASDLKCTLACVEARMTALRRKYACNTSMQLMAQDLFTNIKTIIMEKRPFQIWDEMNVADEKNGTANIALCNQLISATTIKGGGQVSIGVPHSALVDMFNGKTKPYLILLNQAEYERLKSDHNAQVSDTTGAE